MTPALLAPLALAAALADEPHAHPAPERLGTVHFESSCPAVQADLERSMALLHSFAYDSAAQAFRAVAARDPKCALAHWGVAMSLYHQLWSPPDAAALKLGRKEVRRARHAGTPSARERGLIEAAGSYYSDLLPAHHAARAAAYSQAMAALAARFPADDEVQILYALSLLGTARPTDRSHANQKRAAAILEPIYARQPQHPGVAHYLIHAYDSSELAERGLAAARAYGDIAPSAPHALHMPSHIFTRLGLWEDSIRANEAARRAAHAQGDTGEELHAMDYLTYAYLQDGRVADAERIVGELHAMAPLLGGDFKVGYAATAMPVRLAVETRRWADAAAVEPLPGAAPQIAALAHWARALGHAQTGHPDLADQDIAQLDACAAEARGNGDAYWAAQIVVLSQEAHAWRVRVAGSPEEALSLLRAAADAEDALEKLPVTPGPVVPAREQLGRLLLELGRPAEALVELKQALIDAPGRRAAREAASAAAMQAAQVVGRAGDADAHRREIVAVVSAGGD